MTILQYGISLQIQADNESYFQNKFVQQYAEQQNIQCAFCISYYPQATGLAKWMNGLMKEQLRKLGDGSLSQ